MHRKLATALLTFATIASACSVFIPVWLPRTPDADPLFRFIRDGKAGYMDGDGKVVIPPQFQVRSNFEGEFHSGLLRLPDNKFIDRSGRVVIARPLKSASDFSDGMALVTLPLNGPAVYMDTRGALIQPPAGADRFAHFSEGLAAMHVSGRYGYIDKSGRFAIPPQYLLANDFHDGMARVVPAEGACRYQGNGPCGAIPIDLPQWPPSLTPPQEPRTCKVSFVDRTGKLLTARFDGAEDFSEGLAAVRIDEKWGFIDLTGRLVIPPRFLYAGPFSERLAWVIHKNNEWAFIDRSGSVVIPARPTWRSASSFHNGRARVIADDRTSFYIDTSGKRAIPDDFAEASDFFKGFAHVQYPPTRAELVSHQFRYAWLEPDGHKVFEYTAEPMSR